MHYRLNDRDLIVDLSADWDDFAAANDGDAAVRAHVIGRPLADFIAGDPTRMYMAAALQAVRLTHQSRTLAYRCDSPSHRRHFEMSLRLEAGGSVLVEHHLQDEQPRARRAATAGRVRHGWRCSVCLRVREAGAREWREPDTLQGEPMGYDVCPDCERGLFHAPAREAVS